MSVYSAAREWMECELAAAECRCDRSEVRAIGLRIVEIIELEDFDECYRLDAPIPCVVRDAGDSDGQEADTGVNPSVE